MSGIGPELFPPPAVPYSGKQGRPNVPGVSWQEPCNFLSCECSSHTQNVSKASGIKKKKKKNMTIDIIL